jgi:hypothetical protein
MAGQGTWRHGRCRPKAKAPGRGQSATGIIWRGEYSHWTVGSGMEGKGDGMRWEVGPASGLGHARSMGAREKPLSSSSSANDVPPAAAHRLSLRRMDNKDSLGLVSSNTGFRLSLMMKGTTDGGAHGIRSDPPAQQPVASYTKLNWLLISLGGNSKTNLQR